MAGSSPVSGPCSFDTMPKRISQIYDDVASRLGATNEDVALNRLVERLRPVRDAPRDQTAFTAMTHARPARPADWNVTRLGQLQNARVDRGVPMGGNAAARKGHQRPALRVALGQMRISLRRADHTRAHRLAAVEDLDADPPQRDAVGCKFRLHLCHEASRS